MGHIRRKNILLPKIKPPLKFTRSFSTTAENSVSQDIWNMTRGPNYTQFLDLILSDTLFVLILICKVIKEECCQIKVVKQKPDFFKISKM